MFIDSSEDHRMQSSPSPRAKLLGATLIALSMCAGAYAEESKLKETSKEVGNAIGTAAREVGHGTKKVTKDVGKAVSEAARETGHAFRDGAKELKKAATSDTAPTKPVGPKK
jgi:hypothetical protein